MEYIRKVFISIAIMVSSGACSPEKGIEITNWEFNNLITQRSIRSLSFVESELFFEIELTDSAMNNFEKQIDDFINDGRIDQRSEFRLFYLVADRDYAIERIREVERDNNLVPIEIKIKE